jgi:hypothetical protein
VIGAEHPLVHVDQQADAGLVGHRQQPHPGLQRHGHRHRRDLGHHRPLLASKAIPAATSRWARSGGQS